MSADGRVPDELKIPRLVAQRGVVGGSDALVVAAGEALYIDLYGTDTSPVWVEHPSLGPSVDVVAVPVEDDLGLARTPFCGPGASAQVSPCGSREQ